MCHSNQENCDSHNSEDEEGVYGGPKQARKGARAMRAEAKRGGK